MDNREELQCTRSNEKQKGVLYYNDTRQPARSGKPLIKLRSSQAIRNGDGVALNPNRVGGEEGKGGTPIGSLRHNFLPGSHFVTLVAHGALLNSGILLLSNGTRKVGSCNADSGIRPKAETMQLRRFSDSGAEFNWLSERRQLRVPESRIVCLMEEFALAFILLQRLRAHH
ncbi:hypothetical protein R1flu_015465 [Riccia fluitans]|uniref:Uncharacterized protein n=1 Tax=Riccia fluitans TaxID=41844 RepID=A0ABD1YK25_9MARC